MTASFKAVPPAARYSSIALVSPLSVGRQIVNGDHVVGKQQQRELVAGAQRLDESPSRRPSRLRLPVFMLPLASIANTIESGATAS